LKDLPDKKKLNKKNIFVSNAKQKMPDKKSEAFLVKHFLSGFRFLLNATKIFFINIIFY